MPNAQTEVIDVAHQKIHDGLSWTANHYDSDVDIAVPTIYRITVPSGVSMHLTINVSTAASGIAELFSGPTLTGQGTVVPAINRNTGSSNVAKAVVAADATRSADGTLIGFSRINGSSFPGFPIGGESSGRPEYVLAPGNYLLKLSTDADNNRSWTAFNWYEVYR